MADCLGGPPNAPTHVSKNILLVCAVCANPCSQDDAFALVVNLYSWVTMVARCLEPLQTFTSFAQGMSIFFDDGGVGNNGQTGWWIAEEESFGESCLLWCPGGLIKGAEASWRHDVPPPFQAFPQVSRNIPSTADTLTILSSSTFQIDFVTPSMGHPSSLPWQVLVVACRRLAGNGVATWAGTRWIFTCCRKMPHRIHGDWLDADGDGLRKHLAMPWLHHSDPFWSILQSWSPDFSFNFLLILLTPRWSSDFFRGWPPPPWQPGSPWLPLHYRTWNRTAWSSQGICCWMSWGRPLFAPRNDGLPAVDPPEQPDAPIDMCH